MARTIDEIQQEILDEVAAQPDLNGLTSNSATSIYRLWTRITAIVIFTLETLWDLFKVEIEEIANKAISGTPEWYVDQAFLFQYGDTLDVINGKPAYAIIDETKYVVDRAAIVEANRNNLNAESIFRQLLSFEYNSCRSRL